MKSSESFQGRRLGLLAVVAFGAALFVGSLASQAFAKQRWTPYHVAELKVVTSVKISPAGKTIAYVISVPRDPFEGKNGPAFAELHVVDMTGKTKAFITGEVNVGSVDWTPDGSRISFLAKRGDDKEKCLFAIPVDGGESEKILSFESSISSYAWGPDGKWVAFLATEKDGKDRKELKEKGFNQEIYEEEWKPAEVWIAKIGDDDAEPRKLDLDGSASSLHVSSDGTRLLLALAPTSLVDDSYMMKRVKIVDVESGEIVAEIKNPGKLGPMAWSPDGRHVALVSAADIHDSSPGRLMIASSAGGNLTEVLPRFRGQVNQVAWQDDRTVMYRADQGCETLFGEVDLVGANRKAHVPIGRAILTSFSLAKTGKAAAFIGQSPTHPGEVFVMNHGDDTPKRLTKTNPWIADMEFAEQEVVEYRARDGLRLEGILVRPLDYREGTRYPLILTVHGGPESHYRNGWMTSYSSAGQMGAAEGFAVFYPNYRGSTGRGVAFSKLNQADPAGKEFDDYVDGVDHLIEIGLVDKDRVGITGGSYGGYASAWGATYYSHRFAASVMFVGISDKIAKWGTSDIPFELYAVHDRHYPWEDWDLFRERSPIFHVEQAKTPLLIMHGKNDPRVHPSQSLELYRYVKVCGDTPVRLVWYPGEGHGNRKAAARLDYSLRLIRWMTHYLKGPGGDKPETTVDYDDPRKKDPDTEPHD